MSDSSGPDAWDYSKEHFELLRREIDKLEAGFAQRGIALSGVEERFRHLEQLFQSGQDNAKRAVDKAEAAQQAHNQSANEWRGTLNDFKTTLITRPEFDRLERSVQTNKDESMHRWDVLYGERSGGKAGGESVRLWAGMAIAVLMALLALWTAVHK